ncbi:MAG TPA: hypothetical protein VMB66_02350 [Candidatus Acidoferrales bacterium]|nr:hypothetical protein [Candidatus Acidoferrales bacterium]
MLRLTHPDSRRGRAFSALLVLVAVCSLAISVATRYCAPEYPSAAKTTVTHKHASSEPGRQRLTKSTANWLPPVVQDETLESPTEYQSVTPASPVILSTFLGQSLSNRPPPGWFSLS